MSAIDEQEMQELHEIFTQDEDNRQLVAEVMLGQDAVDFAKSDIGRYLIGRANIEIREATELLKKTWPWRKRRIQQLQNDVWRAENFKIWLLQQINSGRTALSELDRRTTTGEM